ncbi:Brp/Blh family beta-carotene 15,15'-dioxygenase [Rubrivirga marina]|uniref:Probable beta-carotene 15,15'-dioxygenase n=1 Tax=Rubrivirga marina TaxID=1196024 RepID=A0A271IWC1_9BACT|nr:Brp/Blh family beta-carotene 15,15'-dioxygenase [Rubrivirga marina]PAP75407.1 hypothetical protein BSZ37_02590 [Rubrivirga marina]
MTFPFAWRWGGLALAWGGVLGSLALTPALADAPAAVLALPWVSSAVVLGLPHGAVDPLVPFAMRGEPLRLGPLARLCVAYLALGALVLAAWWAAPTAAAVGFVLLTWAHWGQGDVYALRALGWDAHLAGPAQRVLAGAVRGALPMAVPLAAHPEVYAEVVGAMAAALQPDGAEAARRLVLGIPSAVVWVGLGVLIGVYAMWGAVVGRRRRAWRSLGLDLAEVAGLAVFFAVLPPLWSVGVYFCLWHAVRHLARLGPLVADGSARRLSLYAAPATLGALALIGLVFADALRGRVASVGAYLVGIAALTVPHVVVVAWMDLRQHVWTGR